jgi:hypothetical protein
VPLLDDIASFLAASSTKFSVGSTGNIGKAVALDTTQTPVTFIALYEQSGAANSYIFSTSTGADVAVERPNLQVLSRSTSYQTARNNAQTVYTVLDGISRNLPTSTGTRYLSIEAIQAPFQAGYDANRRNLVSVNFNVEKVV